MVKPDEAITIPGDKSISVEAVDEGFVEEEETPTAAASGNILSDETDDTEVVAEAGRVATLVDDGICSENTAADLAAEEAEDEPL